MEHEKHHFLVIVTTNRSWFLKIVFSDVKVTGRILKVVESYGIFKSTIRLKLMRSLVCLHRTNVLYKTKITDLSKKFCSLR